MRSYGEACNRVAAVKLGDSSAEEVWKHLAQPSLPDTHLASPCEPCKYHGANTVLCHPRCTLASTVPPPLQASWRLRRRCSSRRRVVRTPAPL